MTERHVRVALMEPGAVDTELTHHMRPEVRDALAQGGFPKLQSEDIADAIVFNMVTRPRPARRPKRLRGLPCRRMGINEMLIRPTEQVR